MNVHMIYNLLFLLIILRRENKTFFFPWKERNFLSETKVWVAGLVSENGSPYLVHIERFSKF